MDDDEFDFSDTDLDDLPANTLQHLEATAIHATQHQGHAHPAPESDYGLDDGDEVVNLDDAAGASAAAVIATSKHHLAPPHAFTATAVSQLTTPPQPQNNHVAKPEAQLLARIKKVGPMLAGCSKDLC